MPPGATARAHPRATASRETLRDVSRRQKPAARAVSVASRRASAIRSTVTRSLWEARIGDHLLDGRGRRRWVPKCEESRAAEQQQGDHDDERDSDLPHAPAARNLHYPDVHVQSVPCGLTTRLDDMLVPRRSAGRKSGERRGADRGGAVGPEKGGEPTRWCGAGARPWS